MVKLYFDVIAVLVLVGVNWALFYRQPLPEDGVALDEEDGYIAVLFRTDARRIRPACASTRAALGGEHGAARVRNEHL